MILSNYTELEYNTTQIEPANDKTYKYVTIQRKEKRILLYNKNMQLVNILNSENFGIIDKRKKIPHKGGYIEVADGERQYFKLEPEKELIAVWSEDTNLTLMKLDGTKIFTHNGAYVETHFDKRNDILWTILRNDNEHIIVSIMDYSGNELASLPMDDLLYKSMFTISELPEKNRVAISFGGGQDGCQDYFIEWENKAIKVVKTLPDDLTFMFCDSDGKKAYLLDFYDKIIYCCSYPGLKKNNNFAFDDSDELEEYGIGSINAVNDKYAIFCNDYNQRFYLFDLENMKLGEEIIVKGYEPKEDKNGEIYSDIDMMIVRGDKLFIYPKGKVLVCQLSEQLSKQ